MTWNIQTILSTAATTSPTMWVAALVALAGLFVISDWYRNRKRVEIKGSICRICRSNLVALDVGEFDQTSVGQIFTVYKRLAMCEVWNERRDRPNSVRYTAVGQAKVVSTTRHEALCKFRTIKGYSHAPCIGDTVYFSSTIPLGSIHILPQE